MRTNYNQISHYYYYYIIMYHLQSDCLLLMHTDQFAFQFIAVTLLYDLW